MTFVEAFAVFNFWTGVQSGGSMWTLRRPFAEPHTRDTNNTRTLSVGWDVCQCLQADTPYDHSAHFPSLYHNCCTTIFFQDE